MALFAGAAASQELEIRFERASTVALDNPHDLHLSADGKLLFVSDGDNDRIAVLDALSLELVAGFGDDRLDGPHGIDLDDHDRLYVADAHNNRVVIYALNGAQATFAGELSGGLSKPKGVATGADGTVLVAGAWSRNIVVYRDGAAVNELRGLGTPLDLEQVPGGDVWYSDSSRNRLVRIGSDLGVKAQLGEDGALVGPHFIDVTADGDLVVSEKFGHRIRILMSDGRILATLGTGKPGAGEGELRMPEGVETAGEYLWVADSGNDRVVRYRVLKR